MGKPGKMESRKKDKQKKTLNFHPWKIQAFIYLAY